MHLDRVRVERLRNIINIDMRALAPLNVIHGANGSGKSSLIEALHLLGTGRSFRTVNPRYYIQHHRHDLLIYAESKKNRLGFYKTSDNKTTVRLDGETVVQSEIARILPVQLINPENMDLLETGSKPRRQLLDWLMFHVEHEFHGLWLRYQRALKQRNALLKLTSGTNELLVWEQEMAITGERIHQIREIVLDDWSLFFKETIQELLPEQDITIHYSAGFDVETGLLQTLIDSRARDKERGHSGYGIHRADLRFRTAHGTAEQTLSRGQKKMLILALKLSQIKMLYAKDCASVVLLDDMTAELDASAQTRLIALFISLRSQVFMTTVDLPAVLLVLKDVSFPTAFFHLKDGCLVSDVA
jgi:DNA replication and repair protein RecF